MMRRLMCLAMLLLAHSAHGSTIEQHFGEGAIGIKWGTPLTQVQAKFPHGYTWETVKIFGMDFIHSARVDIDLFGLDSRELPVHFGFDKSEKLIRVGIFFPYDRKADVLYKITEALGPNYQITATRNETHYSWPSQSRVQVTLVIGNTVPYTWTILRIHATDSQAR